MADPNPPPDAENNPWRVFGDDSQGIVEQFELLRGKLIVFFENRRCLDPEELADETLERIIKKLCEGTKVSHLIRYSYGVAKNIFYEYLRTEKAKNHYAEEQKRRSETHMSDENDDAIVKEEQLKCLERCTARLSEQEQWLLAEYYSLRGNLKLEHRRNLAEQLNITRAALTLRIFHLKQKLKKCINDCLEYI
jgi:DNA-directed RNA polymerase specialized sigma subunit, sigma24 homolog